MSSTNTPTPAAPAPGGTSGSAPGGTARSTEQPAPTTPAAAKQTEATPAAQAVKDAAKGDVKTEPKAAKPAEQPKPKTVNIGGKEVPEAEAAELYKLHEIINTKLRDAEATKKQADEVLAALADPAKLRALLKSNTKLSERQLAEEILSEHLEDELLTDDQKSARDKDRRLKEYEEREAAEKTKAAKAAEEAQVKHWHDHYQTTFLQGLQESGLPATAENMTAMVKIVRDAAARGLPDVQPALAAKLVKQQQDASRKTSVAGLSGEDLLAVLPAETQKAFIAAYERQLATGTRDKAPDARKAPEAPKPAVSKKLKGDAWMAAMLNRK